MIGTIVACSVSWTSGWAAMFVFSQLMGTLSSFGIVLCLVKLRQLSRAAEQVDFATGLATYQLADVRHLGCGRR